MFFDFPNNTSSNNKYYDILNLNKNCSQSDIKKSYHKLAMIYHPDKNKNNLEENSKKFKDISEAYSILSDPKKRQHYDKFGNTPNNINLDPFSMFNNIFSDFKKQKSNTDNIFINLPLSLEEIHNGCSKIISYNYKSLCNYCDGTGSKLKNTSICNICNGTGSIKSNQGMGMIQFQTFTICNNCNGSGQYIPSGNLCNYCNGTKFENLSKSVNITINKNIKYNEIIKLIHKGHQKLNHSYSDVIIKITEIEHKLYKRINNSNNLYMELSILLSESLTGFKKIITNLNNQNVLLQSPKNFIIKPNMILISDNLGINGGNLYIKFNIIFPNSINDIQIKYLSKLLPKNNHNYDNYNITSNLYHNKNINIINEPTFNHSNDIPSECNQS